LKNLKVVLFDTNLKMYTKKNTNLKIILLPPSLNNSRLIVLISMVNLVSFTKILLLIAVSGIVMWMEFNN